MLITAFNTSKAQLYNTRNGFIGFYSTTPFEDIDAKSNQVYTVMNINKKTLAFSMLMKGFVFKKELMQENFNENYVESDKYPKATFTGSFSETIDTTNQQPVLLHITSIMTMHSVSKSFTTTATVQMQDHALNTSSFILLPQGFLSIYKICISHYFFKRII